MTMKRMSFLVLMLMLPMTAVAGNSSWNVDEHGVVLGGYDVVAYHTQDRAVRGSSAHAETYDGATFYFASAENQKAFHEDPKRFVPKFGGFCAFGVAKNHAKVPTDPETFKIHNGELLVFFNDVYNGQKVNTKILWNQSEESLYREAVATWPTLR